MLTYRTNGEAHSLTVMQGYAEVLPDRVIILAEISERAEEIDVARSRAKMEEAQAQLSKAGSGDVDWQVAATTLRARASAFAGGVEELEAESWPSMQHRIKWRWLTILCELLQGAFPSQGPCGRN